MLNYLLTSHLLRDTYKLNTGQIVNEWSEQQWMLHWLL